VLIELIAEMIVDIFGLDRSRSIPIDQNLTTLGMDSLLAIQLSNRLKTSFATAIPSTLTFQYPTIEAIAEYLMEHLTQTDEQSQPGEAQQLLKAVNAGAGLGQQIDSHQAQTILANLDQLSNRAIETLLDEIESDSSSA
jgi:acyl carrier protein